MGAISPSGRRFWTLIGHFAGFFPKLARTVFRPVCSPGNSILSETGYSSAKVFGIGAVCTSCHAIWSERLDTEELNMKKLLLALTAVAAFTGSAMAADLAPRPYAKAPMPMPVAPSWTGFYIFGGVGGGLWDADTRIVTTGVGTCLLCTNQKQGGDGWYGTVGAGYDWQFNSSWVAGIFADGQFGSIKGSIQDQGPLVVGGEKNKDSYAAGVRLGYLVAPNVLSYVNAGYSGSDWSGTTLLGSASGLPSGLHTNSFTLNGGFVGGGVENNLNIFGISAPGWFMKTEYRAAYYGTKNISELFDGTNALDGRDITFKPLVQTISTSLVYRFNWTGPVVAKY
jgi:outer membrane immunogenic protein